MKHILFICRHTTSESSPAEEIFAQQHGVEILYAEPGNNAKVQLNPALVEWADIIFVMTKTDRDGLLKKFRKHLTRQQLICLENQDISESPSLEPLDILKRHLL
ncbi:MAG: hypothetical protein V2I36_07480 [Desulfopila sp.]|jgi:predicted protein tyrosine phosphatase|nr:hypothetical protein [Desulfopila sp.]